VIGNVLVPRKPQPFSYDLDGNLTSDGRRTYSWDAENRLLRVQSRLDTPQGSWRRVEWQYDALGRRIRQTTWSWLVQSNLWVVTEELRMVSDPLLYGRHLLELNATNVLVRSYVWGLDLSGTLEGAGGVGGLLWVTLHTASGPAAGTHFVAYDGNGNIVALSAASDGSVTARYEYGPFGEPIRVSGPAAALNPFRFSTKRTCNTSDLVLYEYRAYSVTLGRWLSRDPLGEWGGLNPYGFAGNDALQHADRDGRFFWLLTGCSSKKCICKTVKVTPGTGVQGNLTTFPPGSMPPALLNLGIPTPYTVEVVGDASKCKCKYVDSGSIKYDLGKIGSGGRDFNTPGDTHEIPCASGTDWPGLVLGVDPHGSLSYTLTYNLTVTITCTDSGGDSISDSATISGEFKGEYKW
jgi:RHS repeat-associated protein